MSRFFNNERLKLIRMCRGKILQDVANEVGVTKQALSLFEMGKITPKYSIVSKMADVFNIPIGFFFEKDDIEIEILNNNFFNPSSLKKKEQNFLISKLNLFLKIDHVLNRSIIFNLKFPEKVNSSITANYLRDYWGLNDKPISNCIEFLESKGIIFVPFNGDMKFFYSQHCIVNGEQKICMAFSNNKFTLEELNYLAAKELWFIVNKINLSKYVKVGTKDMHDEADKFAMDLLIPFNESSELLQIKNRLTNYIDLSKKYKLPTMFVIRRAHVAKLINNNQFLYLKKRFLSESNKKSSIFADINDNYYSSSVRCIYPLGTSTEKEISVKYILGILSNAGIKVNEHTILDIFSSDVQYKTL